MSHFYEVNEWQVRETYMYVEFFCSSFLPSSSLFFFKDQLLSNVIEVSTSSGQPPILGEYRLGSEIGVFKQIG